MDLVTLEALMAYWGINMVALGSIVALIFATTALAKQHFGLSGKMNLLVSGGAAVIWSLLIALPVGAKPVALIAYVVLGFLVASGGWQAFKDILEKGGEKFAGFKPAGAGDRLIDKKE